jgi:hypothetical protein
VGVFAKKKNLFHLLKWTYFSNWTWKHLQIVFFSKNNFIEKVFALSRLKLQSYFAFVAWNTKQIIGCRKLHRTYLHFQRNEICKQVFDRENLFKRPMQIFELMKVSFVAFHSLCLTYWNDIPQLEQRCQIFLGTTDQRGQKCTKRTKNLTKDLKNT